MSDAETVRVDLGDRSYGIVIGDGVLARRRLNRGCGARHPSGRRN